MSKKGFTLIEMLIVIAIIAILASVFLVGMRGFRGSAYDSRRISDLQKMQSYLELYYTKNRAYPSTLIWDDGSCGASTLCKELVDAGIGISSIPNDPLNKSTGAKYEYAVDTTDKQSYVLKATLNAGHSALDEPTEIDSANIFGLNCEDPSFCIRF